MRVLTVSSDTRIHDLLRAILMSAPEVADADVATTVAGAEAMLDHQPPDVVLVTEGLPDGSVFDLLRRLDRYDDRIQVVALIDRHSGARTRDLIQAGASDVLVRSDLDPDRVVRVLVQAVERHSRSTRSRRDVSQLEMTVRMFEQFAQTVAHDVRRPLGAIQMLSEVLVEPRPDAIRVEDIASRIGGQARQLLEFTDELLADARRMADDRRQTVSVEETVAEALKLLGDRLRSDQVEVITNGAELWAREGQLRQAMLNLLGNAAHHGGDDVRVRVGLERRGDEVVLTVDDDGPGIPLEDRSRATEPGVQLTEVGGGHGLGLAAVDLVMHGHGGSLELDESPMGGLRVVLRFPNRSHLRVIDMPEPVEATPGRAVTR